MTILYLGKSMTDWADDTDDVPKASNWAEQDDLPEPTVVDDGSSSEHIRIILNIIL